MPPAPSSVASSYGPSRVPFGRVICGEARSIPSALNLPSAWHPASPDGEPRTRLGDGARSDEKGSTHGNGLATEALRRRTQGPTQRRAADHPGAAEDDQGRRG